MLMISFKTIVILLMLGLLFLGDAPPPVVAAPLPAADTGSDWIRLITLSSFLVTFMIFLRVLLGALATSTTPLLTWLVVKSAAKPYRGVKR